MKRLIWFVVASVVLPLSAGAQEVPAAPPAPPAPAIPAAPVAPPAPPVPMPTPVPPAVAVPVKPFPRVVIDSYEVRNIQNHVNELRDQFRESFQFTSEQQQEIAAQVKLAADQAKAIAADHVANMQNFKFEVAPFEWQGRGPVPMPAIRGNTDDSGLYNSGLNAVSQRQYDRAITLFDRVLSQGGSRADGALYWQACAQARLARTEDSLATLAALRRDYPQSRYLTDAKVLEADVRKMAGQKIDPQTLDANDEIKLLAINGIANTNPDQAIPLLEGVLNATNTLNAKKRAL